MLLCAWTIARVRLVTASLYVAAVHIPDDHLAGPMAFSAGGIWTRTRRDGRAIIDAHRGPLRQLPVIWLAYSGWIEARNAMFNRSYEYIIHSLGQANRHAYVGEFLQGYTSRAPQQ